MRRLLGNIISVICSLVRFSFLKLFHGKNVSTGMVERFSPNVVVEIYRGSRLRLGDKVRAHSGTKIKAINGGEVIIGSNVRINYNCLIICMEKISIGEDTVIAPSAKIYDHDHDYRIGIQEDKYLTAPVEIGKGCWIGANAVILRGTKLGDNCVVGAGCVISGEYPANSLIVQKRETTVKAYEVK